MQKNHATSDFNEWQLSPKRLELAAVEIHVWRTTSKARRMCFAILSTFAESVHAYDCLSTEFGVVARSHPPYNERPPQQTRILKQ